MTDEVLNQETELSELLQIRRDKLDELRKLGIDPFGQKYVRTEEAGSILKKYEELTKEEHGREAHRSQYCRTDYGEAGNG